MKAQSLAFLLLFLCNTFALSRNIYFQQLGSIDGLSQSSAVSIWQDTLGRMWIGNDALNCYDGENVETFRLSTYFRGVEDANVHAITGNHSSLFALVEDKLIRMDLETKKLHLTDIKTNSIYCLNNRVYYFGNGGFNEYNWETGEVNQLVVMPDHITGVKDILYVGNDVFWLASPQGIFIVDVQLRTIRMRMLENESTDCLYKDSNNYIWIITRSAKIYTTRPGSYIPQLLKIDTAGYQEPSTIFCVMEDKIGSIWLGTLSGLYQIKKDIYGNNEQATIVNHVLPESNIYALCLDQQGSLWVGSYYGNVRYFNPEVDNYTYYATDENHRKRLHGAVIGKMIEDDNQILYIATEGSGINIKHADFESFYHLKKKDGLRNNKIRSLWLDRINKRLFISEYMQGISYYNLEKKQIHSINDSILNSAYKRIIEEMIPYKQYLILRTQDGIFCLHTGTLKISRLFDDEELHSLCSGITRTIFVDKNDVLWVSSYTHGLFTVNLKTNQILKYYGDGIKNKQHIPSAVVDICEHSKKGIFMATLNAGVLAYDNKKDEFISYIEENNQIISNIAYNVRFSWYDNLIVTTNRGISILNLTTRDQVNSIHHIPLSNSYPLGALSGDCGILSSRFSDRIYIGGLYGLLCFSEKDLIVDKSEYSLYFSSLSINNIPIEVSSGILPKPLFKASKISLPYKHNTFTIDFAITNYLSTKENVFEYKMDGIDEHWNITQYKSITYNSLPPGKYTLLVREKNNINKTIELDIHIQSSAWTSFPAIIAYLILLGIVLLFIVRFAKNRTILLASLASKKNEITQIEEINKNRMDLFINLSNEFRTPVTLILSQTERLIREMPHNVQKKLDKIKVQTLRLQDLISELNDIRRIEQNNLKLNVVAIELNLFLEKIYDIYVDFASDKKVTYKYLQSEEYIYAFIDLKLFQKVIYNLLAFVFDFATKKDSISLCLNRKNEQIEVSIKYNGLALQKETCDYLTKLMNSDTVHISEFSSLTGGGMSLLFSKRIIILHKGEIQLEVGENELIFTIRLNMGNSHFKNEEIQINHLNQEDYSVVQLNKLPEEEELKSEQESQTGKQRIKLLLVENNDDIRLLLKEMFSFNYEVIEMDNAKEAYEYASNQEIDIIISEIMIPETNGIELCNMLKNNIRTFHIPVILLSSQPSEKQEIESIRVGADEYIVKPFNVDILILKCNQLVKKTQKLSHYHNSHVQQTDEEMTTNKRDREFLALARQVVENNLSNPNFDTSIWSKELGVGRTRLFSQIKNITGMTPNDYLLQMKLNKCLVLLSENGLTIGEIAYQLGFSSPAYFSKCFKNHYGITPADYRKKL
ncbi:hybrid sensor histidine kinase/response regulator transcription factor [Bacteroides sp. 519]|uniref:hybrid sensor histidine kinase/response regulator transcription factor n=1 Tax=Bacteroides sp. 519 TaxID=2302937 RepID=UPI0013D4E08C|nr:hybrid sensor histidine kinase/response regulator transcription factor [Bacteroides sp. 519]NDV57550.1 hybrid sensor histidine kinase/response regulator [Bacteroides sp. 519]